MGLPQQNSPPLSQAAFEQWIHAIDALVIRNEPSLTYALDGKHSSPDGPSSDGNYSSMASWTQPGGIVFVNLRGSSVRVMGVPLVVHPVPTGISSVAEREAYARQEVHRFEYYVNSLSVETAERVAESIVAHLRGPAG